jgi:hypothetical protein
LIAIQQIFQITVVALLSTTQEEWRATARNVREMKGREIGCKFISFLCFVPFVDS